MQQIEIGNVINISKFKTSSFPSQNSEVKHLKIDKNSEIFKVSDQEVIEKFAAIDISKIFKSLKGTIVSIQDAFFFDACFCWKKVTSYQKNCR